MTTALQEISKAEQWLERAEDIVDILEVRDKMRGIEALLTIADRGFELQQKATIIRLKAERKAGTWLKDHLSRGRPTKRFQAETFSLNGLHISKAQSSRWQLIASVPHEKFNGWIDEHVSRGWEISAAGLRRYARNLDPSYIFAPSGTSGGIYLVPPEGVCSLQGFKIRCDGPPTTEHIIARGKARGGSQDLRDYLNLSMNLTMTCYSHNVGKLADTSEARCILILQKVHAHGLAAVKRYLDEIPWKVPTPEFTLEAILEPL